MGTLSRSFLLVKESFSVLKKDKEIMWFPILSSITTLLLLLSFIIPVYTVTNSQPGNFLDSSWFYLLFFIYYLLSYFVVIFFNTGLITCANIRLNGGDPTFSDGFKNAKRHVAKIFIWALISATIGIILKTISEKSNLLGRVVIAIIGMAWSLLTFFVVPVMIFENISVVESIKKSSHLFKKTWGENVVGQFSMGFFFFILALIGLIPMAILIFFLASSAVSFIVILPVAALLLMYLVLLGIISSSLNGIFVAALYNYANSGKIPSSYSREVIESAFKEKQSHGFI